MPTTITPESGGRKITLLIPAGETSPPMYVKSRCVITVKPGSGGTMSVEASWSAESMVTGGTATWFAWDAGTISANTLQLLELATAVRFTATAAAGTGEISQ